MRVRLKTSRYIILFLNLAISLVVNAKQIALTFDDAPVGSTLHFDSVSRTETLIQKLKDLKVPPVMVFANPCKVEDNSLMLAQLKKYRDAGHLIGNHTCSHPRLDKVGFDAFIKDTEKADVLLEPIMTGQKYFRFPYLNEGKNLKTRNQMRRWLKTKKYRNAYVTVDNDDTILTDKLNAAKKFEKKIDYKGIEQLFVKHILTAAEFYDQLAIEHLGYSPKHILLLHEIDGTVLYIEAVVNELRKNGWTIISAEEAYKDPLYQLNPKNTEAGNGLLAQIAKEKTGQSAVKGYYTWEKMSNDLDRLLGLK